VVAPGSQGRASSRLDNGLISGRFREELQSGVSGLRATSAFGAPPTPAILFIYQLLFIGQSHARPPLVVGSSPISNLTNSCRCVPTYELTIVCLRIL
jgi:hypothetical protein